MKDTLIADLRRFTARISGKLLHIDGPYRDKRGICYRVGERCFRSWNAARRYKDQHNNRVRREAML